MAPNYKEVERESRSYAQKVAKNMPVKQVYLFGSYAKGTASSDSDVDMCFFFDKFTPSQRIKLTTDLLRYTDDFDAPFEPLAFEMSDIADNNPFVAEIIKTGKRLV
jgi:predicted nucleotidyltransferase